MRTQKGSSIDILGYCMNIAAKIASITEPNGITIGEDVYNAIRPTLKKTFRELNNRMEDWKYTNRQTGQLYKIYSMKYSLLGRKYHRY
jgi:adenylate cyclase